MTSTVNRCSWCENDIEYMNYHDNEWGKHVKDDKTLFEFLILESAQAGLSWITILRKREGYRRLFANFDVKKVAALTDDYLEEISKDPSIIRHRGKIRAAVTNAQVFIQIQEEYGSFYNYLYQFLPDQKPIINTPKSLNDVPTESSESKAIAKDLKKRGVKFFGSTICYAFMQAVGMVNDHVISCDFKH